MQMTEREMNALNSIIRGMRELSAIGYSRPADCGLHGVYDLLEESGNLPDQMIVADIIRLLNLN